MELYKLFCLIHRHTGFEAMYQIQREMMLPEEYERSRKRAEMALQRLNFMRSTVYGMLGDRAEYYDKAFRDYGY